MINKEFWKDKRVLVTGHTGFKGTWLSIYLNMMGAKVTGYSLPPNTSPSLYELSNIGEQIDSYFGDIRNLEEFSRVMKVASPEIIIHMAAQPLVRESYKNPVETYSTNVMGTVNLFECVRRNSSVKAVVNVTTDKCYENNEWVWGYRENEPLGGYDPYSNSKACSELVTSAYRNSFFNPKDYPNHGVAIASARAGNVIGGGDWAEDRLIPDCINSLLNNEPIIIRNPNAIRPWQHVLEPITGYLLLAEKLYSKGIEYGEAWNFGPEDYDAKPVKWIVDKMLSKWKGAKGYIVDSSEQPHEANYLKLDCSKAKNILGWHPRWELSETIEKIIEWVEAYNNKQDILEICKNQIINFENKVSVGE